MKVAKGIPFATRLKEMGFKKIYILLFALLFLAACKFGVERGLKEASEINISVARLDLLLNEYVELNSFSALQKLNTEYAEETRILIEDILEIGEVDDDNINGKLKAYFNDTTLHTLMEDALLKFENMEPIEKELTRGFRKLKDEIPDFIIPFVYSQFSALNGSIVVGDSLLGFSLDKYMGEEYPLYKRYYYAYQRRSMNPERIAPDCFHFYLMSEYPFPDTERRTLLNMMLYYGKIHYVVTRILDYKAIEDELGFTREQAEWCNANKKNIWNYMVENSHIFATDPMIIRKYLMIAPYTSFFGDDSPHLIGIWMGANIVESYMKNNKKVTIGDLLQEPDFQKILDEARFKP